MLDKLLGIEKRYEELNRLLLEVGEDYQRAAELNKERLDLEPMVVKSKEYRRDMARLDEARSVLGLKKILKCARLRNPRSQTWSHVRFPLKKCSN